MSSTANQLEAAALQATTNSPVFRRRKVFEATPTSPLPPPADFDRFFQGWIDSTKKQWGHDRTLTLGGSEVFGCIRKAWYSRHGATKDSDYHESWGATRRGDMIENHHVVPAMEWASANDGFKVDYAGSDQQTLFCDGVPMSVTPDGLIHGIGRDWLSRYGIADIKSDCVMFEIKSIDPRVDLSEEKSIHHGQTQIQMGLVRENTKFSPHYAVILYVNASFLDDMNVFIVEWDEKKYEVAKARAHVVYETESPNLLMREGRIDGSCTYCPFKGTCIETMVASMPAELTKEQEKKRKKEGTNPLLLARLDDVMDRAHKARAAKKKAEKVDELAKEELKAILREFGERKAKDANWSLSYSMSPGRKTVDTERVNLALAELQVFLDAKGLGPAVDQILRNVVGVEPLDPTNPDELLRLDHTDSFMKSGDPFEVLRMTFTEPEAEEI
jgi:histone H3/H4